MSESQVWFLLVATFLLAFSWFAFIAGLRLYALKLRVSIRKDGQYRAVALGGMSDPDELEAMKEARLHALDDHETAREETARVSGVRSYAAHRGGKTAVQVGNREG